MSGAAAFVSGCRARRQLLAPYGALVALVTGVLVVSLATAPTGTALRLCLPLVVLAVTGLPGLGAELAEARRSETGIAGVRGVRGVQLLRMVVPEPLLVLLLGTSLGCGLGAGAARWLGHRDDLPLPRAWAWSDSALLGVVLVLLLIGVVLGSRALLRAPLFDQISPVRRRGPASRAATFVALLALGGFALAGYRSRHGGTAGEDWLVAAGPALGGLVAGALAVLALHAVGALGRLARGSRLSTWLALRALAAGRDRRRAVVLGVAAGSVALFALSGASAVGGWVSQSARLSNGAELRIPVDLSAVGALQLTRRVDPHGRWLAAAEVTSASTDSTQRQVLLDTTRFSRVLGPTLRSTAADRLGDQGPRLRRGPAVVIGPVGSPSTTVAVRGRVLSGPLSGQRHGSVLVEVNYLAASGTLSTGTGVARTGAGTLAGTIRLDDCGSGCAPTSIAFQPGAQLRGAVLRLGAIRLGTTSLLDLPWQVAAGTFGEDAGADAGRDPAGRLRLRLGADVIMLRLDESPLDVVSTADMRLAPDATLPGTGGARRAPHVVAELPALPFVHAGGLLADLARGALGGSSTPPGSSVYVLARGDTPASVLRQVPASGTPRDVADAEDALRREVNAGAAGLYLLAGLAALLAGGLHVITVAGRTRSARARTQRDLGRVGVTAAVRRRALAQERVVVGTAVLGFVVLGWVVSWWLFGDTLSLVRVPANGLPLRDTLW